MDYVISIMKEINVPQFIFINLLGVIFALTSDMNVASRVDAYLTNMKMPWEKEVTIIINL